MLLNNTSMGKKCAFIVVYIYIVTVGATWYCHHFVELEQWFYCN